MNNRDKFNQIHGEDTNGEGGSGGKAEEVKFRFKDAMSLDPRDDQIVKHLVDTHPAKHKSLVDQQKSKREEYDRVRRGEIKAERGYSLGQGSGGGGKVLPHKILKDSPQHTTSTDPKISSNPNEFEADSNKKEQELTLAMRPGQRLKQDYQPTNKLTRY